MGCEHPFWRSTWCTYFAFLIFSWGAVALQNGVSAEKEQEPKALDSMTLPIFNPTFELFHSLELVLVLNGGICACENGGRALLAFAQVFCTLLVKVTLAM